MFSLYVVGKELPLIRSEILTIGMKLSHHDFFYSVSIRNRTGSMAAFTDS